MTSSVSCDVVKLLKLFSVHFLYKDLALLLCPLTRLARPLAVLCSFLEVRSLAL